MGKDVVDENWYLRDPRRARLNNENCIAKSHLAARKRKTCSSGQTNGRNRSVYPNNPCRQSNERSQSLWSSLEYDKLPPESKNRPQWFKFDFAIAHRHKDP